MQQCTPATRREDAAFDDRLFDPAGLRPPIWFQQVPEAKAGKNRLHLDLYPTGRDNALPMKRRIEIVEAKVAELTGLGASAERRTRHDDPKDPTYFVVMHDPEGNEKVCSRPDHRKLQYCQPCTACIKACQGW